MEQNTMLILLWGLFLLQCKLRYCAKTNASLATEIEHKSRRNDTVTNYSTTEILLNSTAGTHQTNLVSPDLSITLKNEPYTHGDKPSLPSTTSSYATSSSIPTSSKLNPIHELKPALRSSPNSSSVNAHPEVSTTAKTIDIPNLLETTPDGTQFSSANILRSFISVSVPGFGPGPTSYPAETPPFNFDPKVAEFAKMWLQGIATSTGKTPKVLVPKLIKILDYNHSAQRFPLVIRRNTPKTSTQANSHLRPPILHQGATTPHISKRSHTDFEATLVRQRLKPGLLLGKATISAVRNTEDLEGVEKKALKSKGRDEKRIMRMHKAAMTKKLWYSDRTEGQVEEVESTIAVTERELLRGNSFTEFSEDITSSEATTLSSTYTFATSTVSTTQSYFEIAETTPYSFTIKEETQSKGRNKEESHSEEYLIDFLIKLSRLIAMKEKKAVHDVLKHADQIIHGFQKTGQLQWFGQPLIDVTRKFAKFLKDSDIDIIQNNAADLHHTLSQRRHMLSQEVSVILENVASLYDAEDGAHLSEVLNEFVAYPNSTLSSYWLCTNLINNFLRPYRRLTDATQRQQLVDSINNVLKTKFATSGADEKNALRSGGVRPAEVPLDNTEHVTQKKSPHETQRAPRVRKRKHHHRSRKRKREKKRYRMQSYRPDGNQRVDVELNQERGNEDLTLRNMAPELGSPAAS